MSKKLIEMVVVRKLILLLQRGLSERNIARELSISRATVRRYLQRIPAEAALESLLSFKDEALAAVVYPAEKVEAEDVRLKEFESRKDYFLQQLPRTGVTRQLLWMEYKRACPDGFQYSKFCSLLATEQRIGQATMANLEHRPADMVQVDFAGEPLFYFDSFGSQVFALYL